MLTDSAFQPGLVFQRLYESQLTVICRLLHPNTQYAGRLKGSIQSAFEAQVVSARDSHTATAETHRALLLTFKQFWKSLYSSSTCYSCLLRLPQNVLTCKHSLCDSCVRIHGTSMPTECWVYAIKLCPLCHDANEVKFTLKPPTAGTRGISLSGTSKDDFEHGARFLRELQFAIGLNGASLREHFDFVLASGTGSLGSASF